MADLKDTSAGHNCAKVPYDLNLYLIIKDVRFSWFVRPTFF
jgi:hypothetical protein